MQIGKHGSFYIRNGWPTKIIDAMDSQTQSSYIFSPNNELDAVDQIGVGRVMIKAMRYWAAVLGITDETKNQQGVEHSLTDIGRLIAQYDLYCQTVGTRWLLHRNLARNLDQATAWSWAFNLYSAKSFTKDDFVAAFYAYVQTNGSKYAKKAIEKEFDCFKNTYVNEYAFDINRILDEDANPFFAPLRLIEDTGGGHYEKRRIEPKDVPQNIFFYCILKDNEAHLRTNSQIDIDMLLEQPNQVGKYLNLSYSVLLTYLQQIENRNWISLVNNFGSRYIQVERMDALQLVIDYFKANKE